VLPTLAKLPAFRPVLWKNLVAEGISSTESERIRGEKLNFKNFIPFSALSVQNRTKFGRSFVWPLYFLFGPF
jgi:hypothetical protein